MMLDSRERRLKMLWVAERDLLNLFLLNANLPAVLSIPIVDCVPEDARVEGIHYDYERRAFGVVLHHDSFPVVADGEIIPALTGILQQRRIALRLEGKPDEPVYVGTIPDE